MYLKTRRENFQRACCFIGDKTDSITPELKKSIQVEISNMLATYKVSRWMLGMNRGLDFVAARDILKQKQENPKISLECAIPHENQAQYWPESVRDAYFDILERCDKEHLLQCPYTPSCMFERNEYMIRQSDYLLTVWSGRRGIVKRTVELAHVRRVPVIVIDPITYDVTPKIRILK